MYLRPVIFVFYILCTVLILRFPTAVLNLVHNFSMINLVSAWNKQTIESNFLPIELTLLTHANTAVLPPSLVQAEAFTHFVVSHSPKNPNAFFCWGLVRVLHGDSEGAMFLLERSAELHGSRKDLVLLFMGVIQEKEGLYEVASEYLSQIPIALNLARLAKYNADRKYLMRSAEQYQMALRIAEVSNIPFQFRVIWYVELSKVLRAQGLFNESEQAIRQALVLDPSDVGLRVGLARLLIERRHPQLAIQELRSVSSGFTPEYWVTLGEAYVETNQFEQAERSFVHAIETSDPSKRAWVFTSLANFYARQGLAHKAISFQQQAVAIEPSNPWWRIHLANLHLRFGAPYLVLDDLEPVLASEDNIARASGMGIIGDMYRFNKQYQSALDFYLNALETMPASETSRIIRIRLNISRTYLDLGNESAALDELKAILALDPNNSEAIQLIAQIRK